MVHEQENWRSKSHKMDNVQWYFLAATHDCGFEPFQLPPYSPDLPPPLTSSQTWKQLELERLGLMSLQHHWHKYVDYTKEIVLKKWNSSKFTGFYARLRSFQSTLGSMSLYSIFKLLCIVRSILLFIPVFTIMHPLHLAVRDTLLALNVHWDDDSLMLWLLLCVLFLLCYCSVWCSRVHDQIPFGAIKVHSYQFYKLQQNGS